MIADKTRLPAGEVHHIERVPPHTYYRDYDSDYDSDDLLEPTPTDIANELYTRDWTEVDTDAKADAFVANLLKDASLNEREYIRNIHVGANNRGAAVRIIEDKIRELETYLSELDEESDEYRASLSAADVDDTFLDRLVAVPLLEFLKMHLSVERDARPVATGTAIAVRGGGVQDDPHDYKVNQLLQYTDALHDFDPTPPSTDRRRKAVPREHIYKAMGLQIPIGLEDKLPDSTRAAIDKALKSDNNNVRNVVFQDRPHDMIAHIPSFMEYMKTHKHLKFPDGSSCDNPLWGYDLLRRFDVNNALRATRGDLWEAFRVQEQADNHDSGMISPEVWCPLYSHYKVKTEKIHDPLKAPEKVAKATSEIKTYKKVVYLAQITSLVKKMKDYFGDIETTFILDESDNQLSRMIIATEKIDGAISREFMVRTGVIGADMPIEAPVPRPKWHYKICDANFIDGPTHFKEDWKRNDYPDPEVSTAETGPVYRDEDPFKIVLMGVKGRQVTFNKFGTEVTQDEDVKDFSVKNMALLMNGRINDKNPELRDYLTCKRVCDWGQVEHCKTQTTGTHRYVFVSSDRLAGAYAIYRGVSLLSLNRMNHVTLSVPTVSEMLQCTFTMYKSEAVRKEASVIDSLGRVVVSSGGAESRPTNLAISVVMGVVAVVFAFLPR